MSSKVTCHFFLVIVSIVFFQTNIQCEVTAAIAEEKEFLQSKTLLLHTEEPLEQPYENILWLAADDDDDYGFSNDIHLVKQTLFKINFISLHLHCRSDSIFKTHSPWDTPTCRSPPFSLFTFLS